MRFVMRSTIQTLNQLATSPKKAPILRTTYASVFLRKPRKRDYRNFKTWKEYIINPKQFKMKNQDLVTKLKELKATYIEIIDHQQGINLTCGLATNYSELVNLIADLLKTSKKALDGLHVSEETYITDLEYNIADVIGIVIKLLPFSEMQFIDEAVKLLNEIEQ